MFPKRKRLITFIIFCLFFVLYIFHWNSVNQEFYTPDYKKTDISDLIRNNKISESDYQEILRQTGVSPNAAKELIKNGEYQILDRLNDLYFTKPVIEKNYILFPVTAEERNFSQKTPIVKLQKGDILVTFNTGTLWWRHGHCSLVLDDEGTLLEHMSVGETSCKTSLENWRSYPGFAVLRHPDKSVSEKAVQYAETKLLDINYNMLSGIIKKDKSDEENIKNSHCSHIVWQAYKMAGVDIDYNGGAIVTPSDIALSDELQLVQIYGIDPDKIKDKSSN